MAGIGKVLSPKSRVRSPKSGVENRESEVESQEVLSPESDSRESEVESQEVLSREFAELRRDRAIRSGLLERS